MKLSVACCRCGSLSVKDLEIVSVDGKTRIDRSTAIYAGNVWHVMCQTCYEEVLDFILTYNKAEPKEELSVMKKAVSFIEDNKEAITASLEATVETPTTVSELLNNMNAKTRAFVEKNATSVNINNGNKRPIYDASALKGQATKGGKRMWNLIYAIHDSGFKIGQFAKMYDFNPKRLQTLTQDMKHSSRIGGSFEPYKPRAKEVVQFLTAVARDCNCTVDELCIVYNRKPDSDLRWYTKGGNNNGR